LNRYVVIVLLGLFVASLPALDRSKTIMEARVYFDNFHRLSLLGDLLGELDICTWQEDETGGYLVINTDADELARIEALGLRTEVIWPDIRDKFRLMTGVDPDDPNAPRNFGYFLTYWEMQDSLDRLVANFPNLCTKFSTGSSYQGKPLWCLKISDNPGTNEDEPACFFNGATHAREPMGTSCCVAFAVDILSRYGTDSLATWLINNREVYIVPVMNPDGYVYNSDSGGATNNWRKNRRAPVPPNIGIDLNRNYGYKWGYDNSGSSGQPSSETYRGPSRFSEPETQVIRDFMASHLFRTQQDFHTYGQYNMYPWGYASVTPPDRPVLQEIVDTFRVNNRYPASKTGQINQTIYPCNGVSVDWEYADTAGKFVTYAFTCELDSVDFWHGWNDSNVIRLECNRNIPNLYYLARICGVFFDPVAVAINDTAQGNANGQLDPGEAAGIWFTIRNRAVHPLDSAYQLSARLVCGNPDVQVPDSIKPFPNCPRRSSVDNHAAQFPIQASPQIPPGTHVPLRLEVSYSDAGHTYRQPVNFDLVIGSSPGVVTEPSARPLFQHISARPNPAQDHLLLEFNPVSGPARLDICSSTGALVSSSIVNGNAYRCDLRSLPAGVYYCRLSAGSRSAVTRFSLVR